MLVQQKCLCIVVRMFALSFMTGSNVDKARQLLTDSGLAIITADSFEDAAVRAVECLKMEQTRQVA